MTMAAQQKIEENSEETQSYQLVISDDHGSLERILINLRRRKFEIISLNVKKQNNQYLVDMELKSECPERLEPLLNKLWDVRKCQNSERSSQE